MRKQMTEFIDYGLQYVGVRKSAERSLLKCWGYDTIDQNTEITGVNPEGKGESYFRCVAFGKVRRYSHVDILVRS